MTTKLLVERMNLAVKCCIEADEVPLPVDLIVGDVRCEGVWGRLRAGYEDNGSFAIFTDSTRGFWAFEECSDSTGHGCQCSGTLARFDTLADALRLGLGRDNRQRAVRLMEQR